MKILETSLTNKVALPLQLNISFQKVFELFEKYASAEFVQHPFHSSAKKLVLLFKKHPKLFDNKLIAMIQVAEQTNQDELVYDKLKSRYDDVLQQQAKIFTSIINPILNLLVGLIVGFILVALYLPMFRLSTVMG